MRRRIERLFNRLAVPLVLVLNTMGAVAFFGGGSPLPAGTPAAQRESVHASSIGPTATSTATPLVTATATSAPEPHQNGFITRTYDDPSGATMTYYLLIPAGYIPSERYPLVLLLHGTGESATPQATAQKNASVILSDPYVKQWSSTAIQAHWPTFILVPQAVTPARWSDGLPRKVSYVLQPQPQPSLQMVMAILKQVQTQYSVNPERIYLTGLSMGGDGAWEAAERWPDNFAAVVPIAGAGDPSKAADLIHTPVWAFQSAGDTVVPVSASLAMIGAIKRAGGHACFTEFSGKTHDLSTWMAVYTNTTMLRWLFAQGTAAATASGMQQCSLTRQ